jgi:signal transduction histidine kinase
MLGDNAAQSFSVMWPLANAGTAIASSRTGARQAGWAKKPPRLRTLLLVSNLAVLALPLAGLWAMRLYESALVRQTESELVAQAAVIAAAFREELRQTAPDAAPAPAAAAAPPSEMALDLARRPGLDLADDPILPPPPDPAPAPSPADPRAAAIGRVLEPILRDAQAVTLAALRVTDSHGIVIASTGTDLGLSLAAWDEVARVLKDAPIVTSMRHREPLNPVPPGGMSRTAGLRVFVAMPVRGSAGVAGAVVLSRTPKNLGQAAWGKRFELLFLAAALLGAGALLAAGLSRLITRPLAIVVAQAQQAARGGDIVALKNPGTREVADLSAALTRMAATLDERARYIAAFAASVSHEFKTPLSALRGAAELLEDHADTLPAEERARLLGVVADSSARLDRLVRRLLDLARADMMRPGGAVATAIGPVLDRLAARHAGDGPRITIDGADAPVALREDALEALFATFFDNVAAHAGVGAIVRVSVAATAEWVRIVIEDDGPGISEANRSRVFDPFFTTTRADGGTGLGLSIARAIATGAGGAVTLLPSARGAKFRIDLPAAVTPLPAPVRG